MQATANPASSDYRDIIMAQLFSDLQIARFNELYYQKRAQWHRRLSASANVISALASSAVVTALLRDSVFGWFPLLWLILAMLAAVCAAVVPILQLDTKASQLDKAAFGHAIVRDRIHKLLRDLKLSELDDVHLGRKAEIDSLRTTLGALDEPPHSSVINSCWDQVLHEYPSDQAWTVV
ncbi:MAG: hypothetical protein C0504_14385 [Candidatus Solibacter sp.]|nr:hypothetical protein [Candidatus Solibacter sp.]